MIDDIILYERQDHVAIVTLNRPHVINAFTRQMYAQFNAAIEHFRDDEEAWVCIVRGAGERGFCSGVDIKAVSADLAAGVTETAVPLNICRDMVTPKPIIAAVHGHCVGEGVNLVLSCDLVVAEESSRFFVSEARVGVNAVDIPLKLARKAGYFAAFEMLLGLEGKSAAWCKEAGLVNLVVADGTAFTAALTLAKRLNTETAPLAIRAMKETLWRAALEDEANGRAAGERWRDIISQSHDWAEGRAAFAEKRPSKFIGQ